MTANKPMTGEQLDELLTVAVNMQRDSEKQGDPPTAMFAYAVQVAVLELRKVRADAAKKPETSMSITRYWISPNGIACEDESGSFVKYEDYAAIEKKLAESQREFRAADATIENLQMQVEKLAAENAGLKAANAEGCKWDGEQWVGISFQTPATDAFLAEVRAQGVEMFAASLGSPYVERGEECYQDGYTHAIERIKCHKAAEFAAKIRKGVQS